MSSNNNNNDDDNSNMYTCKSFNRLIFNLDKCVYKLHMDKIVETVHFIQ